ncbi:hypothetical protein P9847_18625 [Paenibacillus chibensis]|uniref:Uncharacterized protein n=1 Tax=Paenibacillus chibensis TaxID=59846 RepID=A0ABU6PWP6_9BACL|nr:hypothetical protein [Paenibacillus chibensis]
MPTKRVTCTFFNISEPSKLKGKINELLENQYALIQSKKVHNVEVAGVYLRISFLRKESVNQNNYWIGVIERLDTTLQGEASNLDGVRIEYATGADEGPIVNTGFAYYPLTNTFVLHRKIGGVNDDKLGIFIRKLIRQTNIVSEGFTQFKLSILPDLTKIDRFKNAARIKQLEYSFKMPENLKSLKSEKRSILGDMHLANTLGGDTMRVVVRADSLDVSKVTQKVDELLKLGGDFISSLRATTEHNGIEEPLDLLTEKFSDYEDVYLKKGNKETVDVIMDATKTIFLRQEALLKKMYLSDGSDE